MGAVQFVVLLIVLVLLISMMYILHYRRQHHKSIMSMPRSSELAAGTNDDTGKIILYAKWMPPTDNKLVVTSYEFEFEKLKPLANEDFPPYRGVVQPDMTETQVELPNNASAPGIYCFRVRTVYVKHHGSLEKRSNWSVTFLDLNELPTFAAPKDYIDNTPDAQALLSTSPFWYNSPWFQGGAQELML